ncbi:MAG TPA: hypothetical protein EYN95_10420 [Methylococcaceae bacterium]|nr:hypothetical protein [Methylococcaceae bacterium]
MSGTVLPSDTVRSSSGVRFLSGARRLFGNQFVSLRLGWRRRSHGDDACLRYSLTASSFL